MQKNFPPSRRIALDFALLAALAAIVFLPFLDRAYHIDDPLFVWAARHIAERPLDFFGFDVLWYETWEPMWQVTQNPPLGCYYLAAWGSVFGFHETVLHAAMLAPTWAALCGVYVLAGRLGARPMPAAILTLTTPAFMLSGVSVMCDLPLVALWVWSVVAWDVGLRDRRTFMLWLAGVLIAMTTLTKYFGICLIPLLAAYSLAVDRRGWNRWLPPLGLTIALLAGYQLLTWRMYGRGLLGGAMGYAVSFGMPTIGSKFFRIFSTLAFLGGCFGFSSIAALFLVSRGTRRMLFVLTLIVLTTALFLNTTVRIEGVDWSDSPFAVNADNVYCGLKSKSPADVAVWAGLVVQFVVWSVLGAALLALAWRDYGVHRDPTTILLGLWIAGTTVFAGFVNWTLNGRSIVPLIPAIAIVIVRQIDAHWPGRWPSWLLPAMAIPALVLSVTVTAADTAVANVQRQAALELVPLLKSDRPLWISGHWGWQFYAMEQGGKPWDGRNDRGKKGDRIVIPENNCNLARINWNTRHEAQSMSLAACSWLATMQVDAAAGYYAEIWGPLPFAFGRVPPESFTVRRLARTPSKDFNDEAAGPKSP